MENSQEEAYNALCSDIYYMAEASELPEKTPFGKECNHLINNGYRDLFAAIQGQKGIATNQFYDSITSITNEGKKTLLQGTLESKEKPSFDQLGTEVESSGFYEFLIERGIITEADSDSMGISAEHPIAFEEYVNQREALQHAYREECIETGDSPTSVDKELRDFDIYFKGHVLDEYFYMNISERLMEWMKSHESQTNKTPTRTVDSQSAQTQRMKSNGLGAFNINLN